MAPSPGPIIAAWDPVVVGRSISPFEPRPGVGPRYCADSIVDGWATDRLVVRAASVRGYSHRYYGIPRQDDCALAFHQPSGSVVIAVADGISSAPKSEVGAALACRYACEWCLREMDGHDLAWGDMLRGAAWSLVDYARSRLIEASDPADPESVGHLMGTTLTVVLVVPAEGGLWATSVHIGDSEVWLLRDGAYARLGAAQGTGDDAIASQAVVGLPAVPMAVTPVTATFGGRDVLLVGTDGFGDALGNGTGPVGDLFATELRQPPSPLRFAHLLDFSRELFDDDRTLVAVWPR